MDVAVDADLVPGGGDLGGDPRPAGDLLAHEEERRRRARGGERLQRGRGSLGMGAVVERERDAVRAREPAGDAETFGDARDERGRSGPRPAGGTGEHERGERLARHSGAASVALRGREHEGGGRGEVCETRIGPPWSIECSFERLPELASRAGDGRESEAAEGSVVAADVTASPAERDRGAARAWWLRGR